MDNNIFKKFSENLKKVLVNSEKIASEQNTVVNTEHQLLALLMVRDTLACEILLSFEITAERLRLVASLVGKQPDRVENSLSNDAREAIKGAVSTASRYGHYAVDTEHLLLSLLSNKDYNAYSVIERIGVKPDDVRKQIETIFGGIRDTFNTLGQVLNDSQTLDRNINPANAEFDALGQLGPFSGPNPANSARQDSFLTSFTTNITRLARSGKLDPVIGRDNETQRLIQILCRRTKNNPILIGEPGIGKTSIVEGLAQRIVGDNVPSKLISKEILSIDMGSLLAGTMYRGQFESRVKKLLAEIKKDGNVILFIDEIHTVVGAGSTEGSIDAANLLKPMLARGELRLIGSTTIDEYKKYVEKDAAFERRFQPILVREPSEEETINILKGIKNRYEKFHHVRYTNEAIEVAVKLAKRYINDRFLPDKAIDLIDEAAAATNTITPSQDRLAKLRGELRQILRQKESCIMSEEYEKATLLREKELSLESRVRALKEEERGLKTVEITTNDIAGVVARWTNIPLSELTVLEKKKFLDLERRMREHVVGQNESITEVANVIKRARVGISNPNRPSGSFIFLGPTGVGKSELAKVIAEEVLGDRNALIKIDMSEFMERHNVSRLIGAPAGYIGYEEGGKLTEAVRRNPYSVILMDEIEKAHPEVFNLLLQIMEDGELTDARGRKVDFKNTILVMTSNLGTDFIDKQHSIGFSNSDDAKAQYEQLKENVYEALEDFFKPEFLNRVDKILVFRPLTIETIRSIVKLQLKELNFRVSDQKIKLCFDSKLIDWIAETGYDPDFGARPIRKVISDNIEAPLAEAILREEFVAGETILVSLHNKRVRFSKTARVHA